MTATQPDDDRTFTRRGVMRKATAVGVGSAATIGAAHRKGVSPVGSARAIAPIVAAGYAGAAALGYLMYQNAELATGDGRDYSKFTGADALHQEIAIGAQEMRSADERVLTSLGNNVTNSKNVGLAKGKAAAIESMNAGDSESQATTEMEDAVNKYFATIQENLYRHYSAQSAQYIQMVKRVYEHPNLTVGNIFLVGGSTGEYGNKFETVTKSVTLFDDRQIEAKLLEGNDLNNTPAVWNPLGLSTSENDVSKMGVIAPDETQIFPLKDANYEGLQTDIQTNRDAVVNNLSGMISDLFTEYGQGEIPTEDVIDPVTAATELGQNTGLSSQEAAAGMMGIPTSAGFALRLELEDSSGETYEVDAEIYTNAQPNDSDGNPAGFSVGETYDPANYEAPIYVSYEYIDPETGEESTDFTQLQHPFTVLEATDENGDEVQEVTPTSRTNQTADINSIEEELASLREEQLRLQKQAQNPTGGAGGGFFGSNGPSTGVIAAVVGGIGVLYALTQGGSN